MPFDRMLSVAIIGCGDIAGGYDERSSDDGIYSHAKAYRSFPNIQIDGAFDVDQKRLANFAQYWGLKRVHSSLNTLLECHYDIISVCAPDAFHYEMASHIMKSGATKCIWIEKPLASDVIQARELIEMARVSDTGLWLSSQRRWEPQHIRVKEIIQNGQIGEIFHVTGYYVKGITHIGCTLVNTLRFFCGEVAWAKSFGVTDIGSYGNDPSLSGILGFKNGITASVIGCDRQKYEYSIFEIDIVGARGRIRIDANGDRISLFQVEEYAHYSGFKELALTETISTEMKWSIRTGLELLIGEVADGKRSLVLAEEGLEDLKAIEMLKASARAKGIRIEANEIHP